MLQAPAGNDRCPGGLAADMYGDPTGESGWISSIILIISISSIEGADLQHERRLRSLGLPECGEGVLRWCEPAKVDGAEQAGRLTPAGLGGWPIGGGPPLCLWPEAPLRAPDQSD